MRNALETAAGVVVTVLGTLDQLLSESLLGPLFSGPSWGPWRALLRVLFREPLEDADLELFQRLTGRTTAPEALVREVWVLAGRRAGKSRIAALLAVYACCCRRYALAPGEVGVFHVIAADRRQARVIKRYIAGLLRSSPTLAAMIERETKEAIWLTNGTCIEISTASFRTLRGYTCIGAACDEVCFWADETSANPDTEILTALRASMVTVPQALLFCISSPWAKRGEAWRVFRQYWAKDDAPVVVVQAPTRTLNATVSQDEIDRSYADDPVRAATEWGAQFRSDVETFLTAEQIDAVVVRDRILLPPTRRASGSLLAYVAFVDPSGGAGGDSFTGAIAHREGDRVVLDSIFERRPPFSPEQTVVDIATWLQPYGVRTVSGDRFAGEWPREQFRKAGITYAPAPQTKSEIYREMLPLVTSGIVELLDQARLLAQLRQLERRVARGGRESIDHGPSAHDDVVNAAAGALVLACDSSRNVIRAVPLYGF